MTNEAALRRTSNSRKHAINFGRFIHTNSRTHHIGTTSKRQFILRLPPCKKCKKSAEYNQLSTRFCWEISISSMTPSLLPSPSYFSGRILIRSTASLSSASHSGSKPFPLTKTIRSWNWICTTSLPLCRMNFAC